MIEVFYAIAGRTPPLQLRINDGVAEVFMEMLREAEKCSKAINHMPLPLGSKIASGAGAVSWVATYVYGVVFDSFSKKLDYSCVVIAISAFRHKMDNASMGL
ncbi:MAG TPA: hypothetical protein ENJ32_13930 [Crenotrichaceae bacterium]|nr:hypothetical protein [Crenotrichaceae bacterium]